MASPASKGIDTRQLTKKLRVRGALNGFITTENISAAEAVKRAKEWPVFVGVDYVKEVTHKQAFRWDAKDEQSGAFASSCAATPKWMRAIMR